MFGYNSETEEFLDIMKGFKILKDMAKYVMEKIGKMEQTNKQSGNDVLTGKKTEHMITTAGNNTKHILDSLYDDKEDDSNSKEVDIQFEKEMAIVTMEDLLHYLHVLLPHLSCYHSSLSHLHCQQLCCCHAQLQMLLHCTA